MLAGLENYYEMVDRNESFEIADLHGRKHSFKFSPGSGHYVHTDTSTGHSMVIHKHTVKIYIGAMFLQGKGT